MKRFVSLLAFCIATLLWLIGCEEKKLPKIGITQIVEHPALDEERNGMIKGLADAGFCDGKNITIVFENAQGSLAMSTQIAGKLASQNVLCALAISTPSAQSLANMTSTHHIPVVFAAVTDPVSAKLVNSLEHPGGMITGVTDMVDPIKQIPFVRFLIPNIKTMGVIYNPGEVNSITSVNLLKSICELENIQLIEAVASKTCDVSTAINSLIGKVDVLFLPNDNTAVSAIDAIVKIANMHKLPVIAGDTSLVKKGILAGISYDHFAMGYQAGQMAGKILQGKDPSTMPVSKDHKLDVVVNAKVAKDLGIEIPSQVLAQAKVLS